MTETITDSELGDIFITRKSGIKNLSLRLKPDGIHITVPVGTSFEYALGFARSKKAWIFEKKQIRKNQYQVVDNENPLHTLTFSVQTQPVHRAGYSMKLAGGILTIFYPQTVNPSDEKPQELFRRAVQIALRREAKRILPARVKTLAEKYGFSYTSVKINSSKGRWGSCSAQKNINLSLFLLKLPAELVDYVLLHELCHTREMNHSPRFWAELDKVTGNRAKILSRQLKIFSRKLADI